MKFFERFLTKIFAEKISWGKTVLPAFPPFKSHSVTIEEPYHKDCELTASSGDLVLYRRPAFDDEFRFFEEDVIMKGKLGWILGPPGTGKSVAGFAFAASMDRAEWSFIWIKLSQYFRPTCAIFEGNARYTATVRLEEVVDLLRRMSSPQKMLLVVDGFLITTERHKLILEAAEAWRKLDLFNRRLIVISSMSSRGKKDEGVEETKGVKEHLVPSWTLQEYMDALKSPLILKSVSGALGTAPGNPSQDLQELIKRKFYFAGGSARHMLHFPIDKVKNSLDTAVKCVTQSIPETSFMMISRDENAVNRLFALYRGSGGRDREVFVSAYAASAVAEVVTSSAIRTMVRTMKDDISGSGAGSLLETLFCCDLRTGGVRLTFRNGSSALLARSWIRILDMSSATSIEVGDEEWLKPEAETNPGFSLVYVNRPAEMVRFIQLTRSDRHRLNLEPCKRFIDKLATCKISIMEFCFVVNKENLRSFKVIDTKEKPVEGPGELQNYRLASHDQFWIKGAEEMQVTVAWMDDPQ